MGPYDLTHVYSLKNKGFDWYLTISKSHEGCGTGLPFKSRIFAHIMEVETVVLTSKICLFHIRESNDNIVSLQQLKYMTDHKATTNHHEDDDINANGCTRSTCIDMIQYVMHTSCHECGKIII